MTRDLAGREKPRLAYCAPVTGVTFWRYTMQGRPWYQPFTLCGVDAGVVLRLIDMMKLLDDLGSKAVNKTAEYVQSVVG
jgi:hypothetical protein